ncbi:MAG: fimbrial assembly protein, partial [Ectothiorhodospiraceae bacterium]|nr:fimbrial assembly protein [Ectothiorhodospiraceae bacterium]
SSSRQFMTHDGSTGAGGTPFTWSSLNATQKAFLNKNATGVTDGAGANRVLFLRGTTGITGFRNRVDESGDSHILGDMVNSSPIYVSNPRARYPDNWGASEPETLATQKYSDFFDIFDTTPRVPMVYVGGNDGMLHGFNAETSGSNMGKEMIAYIPNEVIPRLSTLTSPTYSHKFFVDGSPSAADAFFTTGSEWKSVLVGGLNRGGQAIYALDITDPSTDFSESSAATTVLWEFSDANDTGDADTIADPTMEYGLGYTYSKPSIVRLHNGKWAAVFGNGYNNTEADGAASTSGYAILYIVDIEDGSVIRKINTKAGSAATPNGLATVTPVDFDGDFITDYIYAGDLLGNMWKFDLTSTTASSWDVAYGSGPTPAPLFVAKDSSSTVQPITAKADVGFAPNGSDLMVYFGTGKYLEGADNTTTGSQTQAFYAVIDDGTRVTGTPSSALLQQTVETFVNATCVDLEGTSGTCDFRVTSDNSLGSEDGWYMELPESGERVIFRPILLGGTVLFVTLIPSGDECSPDGSGWIMQVDAKDGSRLEESPFDLNGDGIFDDSDKVSYDDDSDASTADAEAPASGRRVEGGAPTGAPAILSDSARGSNINYTDTTSDTDASRGNDFGRNTGRQSWRQIK